MMAFETISLPDIVSMIVYTLVGFGLMGFCWMILEWLTPFSLRKELEEDQNIAIAILMGAMFLSLAMIIAAVVRS